MGDNVTTMSVNEKNRNSADKRKGDKSIPNKHRKVIKVSKVQKRRKKETKQRKTKYSHLSAEEKNGIWSDKRKGDKSIPNEHRKFIKFKKITDVWTKKLLEIKNFIEKNKRKPSSKSDDSDEKRLGEIIRIVQCRYSNYIYPMNENTYRKTWEEILHTDVFAITDSLWDLRLNNVKSLLDERKKILSTVSKDNKEAKYAAWIRSTTKSYNEGIGCMKDSIKRTKFEKFQKEYKQYILSKYDQWSVHLSSVEEFIKLHDKRPSSKSKNSNEKSLGTWIMDCNKKYKNKNKIMIDKRIRNKWKKFNKKYYKYLRTREEIWFDTMNDIINYLKCHDKIPTKKNIKLHNWYYFQYKNYETKIKSMNDPVKRTLWENFVINNQKHFTTKYINIVKGNITNETTHTNVKVIKVSKDNVTKIENNKEDIVIKKRKVERKTCKHRRAVVRRAK